MYDELRTPAKALLAQGYTLVPHGHGLKLIDPDGKPTGLVFPGKGRGHQDVKSLMSELAKRGLYPPVQQGDEPAIGAVVRLPVEPRTSHQYRLEQVRASVMRVLRELGGVNDREARRLFVQDAIETAQRHGLRLPTTKVKGDTAQEAVYASARQSLHKLLQGEGQAGWMLDIWQLEVTMLAHPQPHVALNAPAALAAANDAVVPMPAWAADGPEPLASPGPAVAVVQEQDEDSQLRQHVVRTRSGAAASQLPVQVDEADEAPTKLARAVAIIADELAGGPRLGRDVYAVLSRNDIGSRTAERARHELGVVVAPVKGAGAGRGVWTWELPGAQPVVSDDAPPPARVEAVLLAATPRQAEVAQARSEYLAALQAQALAGDQLAADRLERLLGL